MNIIHPRYHFSRSVKQSLSIWLMIAVLGHLTLGFFEQSYVLCVESTGHAQIERAGYDTQHMLPHCLNQTVDGKAIPNDGELPCYDVPLGADNQGLHVSSPSVWKNFIDSGWIATDILFYILIVFSKPAVTLFSPHNLLLDSRIIHRRCTVLLI